MFYYLFFYFWCIVYKFMILEFELRVFDKFNEGDEEFLGVRFVYY